MKKIKIKTGRPLKYKTREDVAKTIQKYFDKTEDGELSVTGLALIFGSKQLLQDYQKRKEFSDIIIYAKLVIENSYERDLRRNGRSGDIFALKNFGWKDQKGIDITSNEKELKALTAIDEFFGRKEKK